MGRTELAWIGLGANLGAPRETLRQAVAELGALPGSMLLDVSRLYRTVPVGPIAQPDFRNAVVALRVPGGPDPTGAATALLLAMKAIERALGRQERSRWGPRELDLDLLIFGPHEVHVGRDPAGGLEGAAPGEPMWLEVPHPAMAWRLFVLAPLSDLAPELVPPGWDICVAKARDRVLATNGQATVQVVGVWDPGARMWTHGPDRAPSINGGSGAAP